MKTTNYFVESDYLTLRLQELFHETVDLQTKFDRSQIESARLKEEQLELALNLKEAHKEISTLVRKLRYLQPGTEAVGTFIPQTINFTKLTNQFQQTG